jgi:hypothetical protein
MLPVRIKGSIIMKRKLPKKRTEDKVIAEKERRVDPSA